MNEKFNIPDHATGRADVKQQILARLEAFLAIHDGHDVPDPPGNPLDPYQPAVVTCRTCGESMTVRFEYEKQH